MTRFPNEVFYNIVSDLLCSHMNGEYACNVAAFNLVYILNYSLLTVENSTKHPLRMSSPV